MEGEIKSVIVEKSSNINHHAAEKSINTDFQRILDKSRNEDIKNDDVKKGNLKTEEELTREKNDKIFEIINSSEAKHIDKIAETDICSGADKYFENDGTLNVRDIILKFGNNISDDELQNFESNITALWKMGLINDENYFYGLRWIEQKVLSKAIKYGIKNTEYNVIDRLADN